ncbi:MAG: divalent-cation tolerance protein CutA [Rhodocyclales bacterium]|nr:divalent-cation tolerance protein CutA [Rhodocyclales bacterium]MDB5888821.1 divalent-cation tolerance protein CutA [Rhodocyclales bacterium]
MQSNSALLVMTMAPDTGTAQKIARALVERRLAACVNILAPCQSVYNWQGAVEDSNEVPMLIKTTASRYGALEAAITAIHPYEVPEIVAMPLSHGLPEYLSWVIAETHHE